MKTPTRFMFESQCLNQFCTTGESRANEKILAHPLNLTKYSQEVTVSKGRKHHTHSHTLSLNSTNVGFSQSTSLQTTDSQGAGGVRHMQL